jgi:hypothetical protein
MKLPTYSSVSAFIAHFRSLKMARARTVDEEQMLAEMSAVFDLLPERERAALDSEAETPAIRRRREHAEISLRRALIARAILSG